MNNTNREQLPFFKGKEKKAVISLVLGVINISVLIIVSLYQSYSEILWNVQHWLPLPIFLIAFIGLTLGLMGLKSSKKKFAVAGIVLSIIVLLDSIYAYIAGIISST